MKRYIVFLICLSLCLFTSCSPKDENMIDSFISFHSETSRFNDHKALISENGPKMTFLSLLKEQSSKNPKTVLTILISDKDEEIYKWMQLPPDERKKELRSYGELVIQYARENKWDNQYYLYISVSYGYSSHIIYDYEKDIIWIPNNESVFISMYQKFQTLNYTDLESIENGRQFLLLHDFAYLKHGEVEYNLIDSGYNVFISSDGEFKSYSEKESTAY